MNFTSTPVSNFPLSKLQIMNTSCTLLPYRLLVVILFLLPGVEGLYAQCETCPPASNDSGDAWSRECYLKNDCTEQGNPCQANDVNLIGSFIADVDGGPVPTCMPGDMVTVALWGQFLNGTSTNRYAVRAQTDVIIDGTCTITLNACAFDDLPPGDTTLALLGTITYICGEPLQLGNTWVAWETVSTATCASNDLCGEYQPSKCSKELGLIDFLSPNFDFSCGELTDDSTEVCFMNLTTGGEGTLTYVWDFGDGNTSMLENPCHTYANIDGPTFIVTLTVIDTIIGTDTVQASAFLEVDLDNLGCCTLDVVCPVEFPTPLECVDDIPAATEDSITILDMCGMVVITIDDEVTGTGCMEDTMYVTRTYIIDDMIFMDTCVQVFRAVDDDAPFMNCPEDMTVTCGESIDPMFMGMPTGFTDNCSTLMGATYEDVSDGMTCPTTITRTWTLVDECGNTYECDQFITIEDVVNPVISCPGNLVLECGVDDYVAEIIAHLALVTASDNCDDNVDISDNWNGTDVPTLSCDQMNGMPITVTAMDSCGNTDECVITVYLDDSLDPVLDCPADLTLECVEGTDYTIAIAAHLALVTALDDCDGTVEITDDWDGVAVPTLSCDLMDGLPITVTATDDCDNTDVCIITVYLTDTEDPVITCPDDLTLECIAGTDYAAAIEAYILTASATDDCDTDVEITDNYDGTAVPDLSCDLMDGLNILLTATDECGNIDTCSFNVYLTDTEDPVITCPDDLTLECIAGTDYAAAIEAYILTASATDDCDTDVAIMDNYDGTTVPDLSCDLMDGLNILLTATDECGHTDTCSFNVYLTDTEDPVITCPDDLTLECIAGTDYAAAIEAYILTASATDDCDTDVEITDNYNGTAVPDLSCDLMDGLNILLTATDECGNIDTCSFNVYLTDTEDPVITCPADLTLECVAGTDYAAAIEAYIMTASATDDCDTDVEITDNYNGTAVPDLSCDLMDGLNILLTATDECGHTDTCSFNVYLDDTQAPSIDCPADAMFMCMSEVPAATSGDATATDDCDADVTVTFVGEVMSQGTCPKILVRTYRATDDCGNVEECTQTITINDTTPPDITCPAAVSYQCLDEVPAPLDTDASATDNCGNAIVTFVGQTMSTSICPRTIVRTYKATDDCGNMAFCTQVITVDDTTPPSLSCPPPFVLEWPPVFNMEPVQPNVPQDPSIDPQITGFPTLVNDNCDGVPVESFFDILFGPFPQDCPNLWYVQRTWIVTDQCNNGTSCVQIITFTDFTPPTIECPSDATFECLSEVPPPVDPGQLVATDNCGTPVVTYLGQTVSTGTCPTMIVRKYKATDNCMNMTTCTQRIVVDDNTPPTITCPPERFYEWPVGFNMNPVLPNVPQDPSIHPQITGTPIVDDNCGVGVVSFFDVLFGPFPGDCPNLWYVDRTWTVTDVCNNSTSCLQRITFTDNTPPTLECPGDATVECIEDVPPPVDPEELIATDNCGTPTVTYLGETVSTSNCPIIIIRKYKATDNCMNMTTCTQRIVVDDTTDPMLTCPPDQTFEWPAGFNMNPVPPNVPQDPSIDPLITGFPIASDNCGILGTVYQDQLFGPFPADCPNLWYVQRLWTTTDICFNTFTCLQTIWFTDLTPPTITCPAGVTVECFDNVPPPADPSTLLATDNCGTPTVTYLGQTVSDGLCPTIIIRKYKATDNCMNMTTCTQTIVVDDTTAPIINCPNDVTIECDDPLPMTCPVVTDNCTQNELVANVTGTIDAGDPVMHAGFYNVGCFEFDASCDKYYETYSLTVTDGGVYTFTGVFNGGIFGDGMGGLFAGPFDPNDPCANFVAGSDDDNPNSVLDPLIIVCLLEPGEYTLVSTTFSCSDVMDYAWTIEHSNILLSHVDSDPVGTCPSVITRTHYAQDECGNVASCTQYITIDDFTAPSLTCPDDLIVQCFDDVPPPADPMTLTATDNCSTPTVTYLGQTVSTQNCPTIIVRTYKATDACMNMTTCTQRIVVHDTTPPSITCPPDHTFEWPVGFSMEPVGPNVPQDPSVHPNVTGFPSGSDNCGIVEIRFQDVLLGPSPQNCPNLWQLNRTWTFRDACFNSASCLQRITFTDLTPPTITCPADITLECIDNVPPPADPSTLIATDNCGTPTVTYIGQTMSDGICPTIIIRTYKATDNCMNMTFCTQTIVVDDTTAPVLDCPNNVTIECDDPLPMTCPVVTDNCTQNELVATVGGTIDAGDPVMHAFFSRFFGCVELDASCNKYYETYSFTVTEGGVYTFTGVFNGGFNGDGMGGLFAGPFDPNNPCVNFVAGSDDDNPNSVLDPLIIVCMLEPGDYTLVSSTFYCDDFMDYAWTIEHSDILLSHVDSEPVGTCPSVITRTHYAVDECGNVASCTQYITIDDFTAPSLTCPDNVTIEWPESNSLAESFALAVEQCDLWFAGFIATDNCTQNLITIIDSDVTFLCPTDGDPVEFAPFVKAIYYTVVDECGNETSCTRTFTVEDTTPPTISCPADVTVECDGSIDPTDTGSATATDAADSAPFVTYSDVSSQGQDPNECTYYSYRITRTWAATDDCGNVSECTQYIDVEDSTAPEITCPPDVTIECDQPLPTTCANATDNCAVSDLLAEPSGTLEAGDPVMDAAFFSSGCNAQWGCDRYYDTYSFTITEAGTYVFTGFFGPELNFDPADDGMGAIFAGTFDPDNPCDNYVAGSDDDRPDSFWDPLIFTCMLAAGDYTLVSTSYWCENAEMDYAWTIEKSNVTITHVDSEPVGSCPAVITRTHYAEDACGNVSSCVQLITIEDTTPPTIECPVDVTVQCVDNVPPPADPSTVLATDNCSDPIVTFVGETVSGTTCPTIIIRTYKATDDCGNMTSCTQTIVVDDTTAPVISCPDHVTIECDQPIPMVCPEVTDNCTQNELVDEISGVLEAGDPLMGGAFFSIGCNEEWGCDRYYDTYTFVIPTGGYYTFTGVFGPETFTEDSDGMGGVFIGSFDPNNPCDNFVAGSDDDSPGSILDPLIITCLLEPGEYVLVSTSFWCPNHEMDYTWTIERSDISLSSVDSDPVGTCPQVITRTHYATDACGNVSSCTQYITIEDTTPPMFTAVPEDVFVECVDDITFEAPMATDNCSSVELTYSEMTGMTILGTLSGSQEVPPTNSTGTGTVVGGIDTATNMVFVCVEFSGLSAPTTAAHIHAAPVGINGGVIVPLPIPLGVVAGSFHHSAVLTDAQEAALLLDGTYINIHTTAFPGGEIRAQLIVTECGTTVKRLWTATDVCGNSSQVCITATAIDETDPEPFACPESIDLGCNPEEIPAPAVLTTIDNCDGVITAELQPSDIVVFGCQYSLLRTYIATDDCGNSVSCTQWLTWTVDQEAPSIDCPSAPAFLSCNPETLPEPSITFSDNCAGDGAYYNGKVYLRTSALGDWNQARAQALALGGDLVAINDAAENDFLASVFGFEVLWIGLNDVAVEGTYEWSNGDPVTYTNWQLGEPNDCCLLDGEDYVVTNWFGAGFWNDFAPGVPDYPIGGLHGIIELPAMGDVMVMVETLVSDTVGCDATLTYKYTVKDACLNVSTCTQTYLYTVDLLPPTITACDDVLFRNCEFGSPDEVVNLAELGVFAFAFDNCELDAFFYTTYVVDQLECGFSVTFQWRAQDECGNVSSCTQTITVEDRTAPILSVPDDMTIQCGDEFAGDASATDNCSAVFVTYVDLQCSLTTEDFTGDYDFANWTTTIINGGSVATSGDTMVTLAGPDGDPCLGGASTLFSITIPADGKLVFSWNYQTFDSFDDPVYDPFGYRINGSFVQLTDNDGPLVQSGLAAALVSAGDVFAFDQRATDCIFGEGATTVIDFFVYTCTEDDPENPCDYTIFRCWSATDECGNTAYDLQRIQVEDTVAPQITCPQGAGITGLYAIKPWEHTLYQDIPEDVALYDLDLSDCSVGVNTNYTMLDLDPAIQSRFAIDRNPVTGVVYLLGSPLGQAGGSDRHIYQFDVTTGATVDLGVLVSSNGSTTPADMTFDASGTLYVLFGDGELHTVALPSLSTTYRTTITGVSAIGLTYDFDADRLLCFTGTLTTTVREVTLPGYMVNVLFSYTGFGFCSQQAAEYIGNGKLITSSTGGCSSVWSLDLVTETLTVIASPSGTFLDIKDLMFVQGGVECAEPFVYPAPAVYATANDNCDEDVDIDYTDGALIPTDNACNPYYFIRTWYATDDCDNVASCTQRIDVLDTTPPVISCPEEATIECDVEPDPLVTGSPTATDNCSDGIEYTHSDEFIEGDCPQEYTIVRTWTATDDCGNASQCTQHINVVDTTPPVLTAPEDVTLDCHVVGTVQYPQIPRLTVNSPGDIAGEYLTALAAFGPRLTSIPLTADLQLSNDQGGVLTDGCDAPLDDLTGKVALIDRGTCTFVLKALNAQAAGAVAVIVANTLVFGEDALVTMGGTEPMVVIPIISVSYNTGVLLKAALEEGAVNVSLSDETIIVGDNCDPYPSVTFTDLLIEGDCAQEFTIHRTWTAADACGNTTVQTQLITSIDTIPPSITCPEDLVAECDQVPEPNTQEVIAFDLCQGPVPATWVGDVITEGDCTNEYLIVRTYRATDNCGNSSSCTQRIQVVDTTPPVIVCPSNVTIECDDPLPTTCPNATDNCTEGELVAEFSGTLDAMDPVTTGAFFNGFCGGFDSRYYETHNFTITEGGLYVFTGIFGDEQIFMDGMGGVFAGSFDPLNPCENFVDGDDDAFQGNNILDPVIMTCLLDPGDYVLVSTTFCCLGTGPYTWTVERSDIALSHVDSDPVGECPARITRTHYATDACGNVASCTQYIYIDDFTDPTASSVSTSYQCPAQVPGPDPSIITDEMDNCDPEPTVTFLPQNTLNNGGSGCPNDPLIITRFYSVTDNCGNSSSVSHTITIVDDTPPTITCPADISVECAGGGTGILYSVDRNSSLLREVDPATGATISSVTITLAGETILGANGLAAHPVTNVLYALLRLSGQSGRELVTINPGTGVATSIGDTGEEVATIAFRANGVLYAVTGDGGSPSETLFTLNITDATPTLVMALGNGNDGEAIAYNPVNGLMYHLSGLGAQNVSEIFESIDLDALTISGITLSGADYSEALAMTYYPSSGGFLVSDLGGLLYNISTSGVVTFVGNPDGLPKGLAFVGGGVPAPDPDLVLATDNCGAVFVTHVSDEIVGECEQVLTRTYSATDYCGNVSYCTQIIYIYDTTPPVLSCPAGDELGCNPQEFPDPAQLVAFDACEGPVDVSVEVVLDDTIGCHGILVYKYTAADNCDNVTTCTQRYTYNVGGDLEMVCTKPAPLFCPEEAPVPEEIAEWLIEEGYASAIGTCTEATVTWVEFYELDNNCALAWTFGFAATDACGGTSDTCYIIIQIYHDDEAPEITCSDVMDLGCNPEYIPNAQDLITQGFVSATDNCGPPSIGFIPPYVETVDGCAHTRVYRYRATDVCGNQSQICTVTVTWTMDNEPPVIDCPDDLVLECPETIPAPQVATATDNCEVTLVTFIGEVGSGSFCDSLIIRTYYAVDACGNAATCTQRISFQDTTPPSITCPDDLTLECGVDEIPTTLATATDLCDQDLVVTYFDVEYPQECDVEVFVEGEFKVVSVIVRTHHVTDQCGNSASCTQHIIIRDDTPPMLTCPDDITIECDQDPNDLELTGVATAVDLCDPEAYATILLTFTSYESPCSTVLTRVWEATDHCGNGGSSEICVQLITIVDTEAPEIVCPDDVTIECGDPLPMACPIVTDNCTENEFVGTVAGFIDQGDPVMFADFYSFGCFEVPQCIKYYETYDLNVTEGGTYTFTGVFDGGFSGDGMGGVFAGTFDPNNPCENFVAGSDDDNPNSTLDPLIITCLLEAGSYQLVSTSWNCNDVNITYSWTIERSEVGMSHVDSDPVGSCPQVITRTHYATDACGNVSSCTQYIYIEDTTAPNITCPDNVTIECGDALPTDLATVSDLCDDAVDVTYVDMECLSGIWTGDGVFEGEQGVMQIAFNNDCSSAVVSGTFWCNNPPVIWTLLEVNGNVYTYLETDLCGINGCIVTVTDNGSSLTAIYDCVLFTAVLTQQDPTCTSTIKRTHYATDDCGNVSSCVQLITIVDTTPPDISCPADVTIECGDEAAAGVATATDICSDAFVTIVGEEIVGDGCAYTIVRTYQAWDDCGNTVTCHQVISVEDTTAPEITCPPDLTLSCDQSTCLTFDEYEVNTNGPVVEISQIIDGSLTIDVTAWSKGGIQQDAALFNTSAPHPNDLDLGTPNTLYGGPGINGDDPDGYEVSNNRSVGNVVIVQTPATGYPNDYLLSDSLVFEFSEPVFIESVIVVDFEAEQINTGGGIFLYDTDGALISFTAALGDGNDNSMNEVVLHTPGVGKMKLYYGTTIPASGGISSICYTYVPCTTEGVNAYDACSDVEIICRDTTINVDGCITQVVRTYSAVDACDNLNEAACTQTITLTTDGQQPDIICPADITIDCEDPVPAPDPSLVVATDNCSASEDITITWVGDYVDGLGCAEVIRRVYRATDECGNEALCVQFITRDGIPQHIVFLGQVFLQAAMMPDTAMDARLNDMGYLPDDQPYNMPPYNYTGTEHCSNMQSDVVDWVLVQLRDAVTMEVVDQKAGLLKENGMIVAEDCVSPITFEAIGDWYYITICHRNHLGIVSDIPMDCTEGWTMCDFTHEHGTMEGMVEYFDGVYAMTRGDVNGDNLIKYNGSNNDKNAILSAVGILTPNNVIPGYNRYDVNMDGVVKYNGSNNDKNAVLSVVGLLTPNNIVVGALYE